MSISPLRLVAAATAAGGFLLVGTGPAAGEACYPPGPNCVGPPAPTAAPPSVVAAGTSTGTGTGASSSTNLARTGVYVVPTALVGLGLVAGGVVVQRSSRRSQGTRSPA